MRKNLIARDGYCCGEGDDDGWCVEGGDDDVREEMVMGVVMEEML